MKSYSFHTVFQKVYSKCTRSVLHAYKRYRKCTRSVSEVYWNCMSNVLTLYRNWTTITRTLATSCNCPINTALNIFCDCFERVHKINTSDKLHAYINKYDSGCTRSGTQDDTRWNKVQQDDTRWLWMTQGDTRWTLQYMPFSLSSAYCRKTRIYSSPPQSLPLS